MRWATLERTVSYTEPVEANGVQQTRVPARTHQATCKAGSVDTLLVLGGNPAFATPADLGFTDALAKVKLRVHLSLYQDETSALCHWHIPEAHFLESWSDSRAYDGTVTILQPLIAPLYGGKTAHEMLASLTSQPDQSSYEIVRGYWQQHHPRAPSSGFENCCPTSLTRPSSSSGESRCMTASSPERPCLPSPLP